MLSTNVLLQCAQPVVRRQVEAALLRQMPHVALYEATDAEAAAKLAEDHHLDIILVCPVDNRPSTLMSLALLRRLQPDARIILMSLSAVSHRWAQALDSLGINPVSLRHLAPTLLRPVTDVRLPLAEGATHAVQWVGRGSPPLGD